MTEYFEAGVGKAKALRPQEIANLIVNKKVSLESTVDEFLNNLRTGKKKIVTDKSQIEEAIGKMIKKNEKAVRDYREGKKSAIMFLLGQVMSYLKGQGDAKIIRKKLEEKLK